MRRQIRRYKGSGIAVGKWPDHCGCHIDASTRGRGFEEPEPVIARRKRFTLVPMDEIEAVEQMKLLGHENFFIFYNANTSEFNVLYRRLDGTYGIIVPEIG